MRVVSLASGSSGNCTLVSGGGTRILIDAGISMTRIKKCLAGLQVRIEDISGILVTHEHSDHISGLEMLTKHYGVPVLAPRTVADNLYQTVAGVANYLSVVPVGEEFPVGELRLRAFHTPHDTLESVGYRVSGDEVFALATDMGYVTQEVLDGLLGADTVVIESNHDEEKLKNGRYPYFLKKRILSKCGHLSNSDCALLAARCEESGTRTIALGHLSRDNNTPELAFSAVSAALRGRARLCVLPRGEMCELARAGGAREEQLCLL